jgi:hypothetical protein
MAEKESPKPFLMRELTLGQKVALAQMTLMPGFQVLTMLIEAGCTQATAEAIKTDPEEANYHQVLEARHGYARSVNKFTQLLRGSVNYHIKHGNDLAQQQDEEVIESTKEEAPQAI